MNIGNQLAESFLELIEPMRWEQAKALAQAILDDLNARYAPREVGVIVRALARLLRKQEYTSEEEQTNNEKP